MENVWLKHQFKTLNLKTSVYVVTVTISFLYQMEDKTSEYNFQNE